MSGMIPQAFLDELLARVPIAEVVGSRVPLKKAGSSLKACCPFHNEKTPSFNVNVKKGYYHCFGCGVSGNAITFLREHDNLSFTEAVEELAKMAGLEVPRDERVQQQYSLQKHMMDALDVAATQYRKALRSTPDDHYVRAYLAKRGLSEEIIERYGIGFAPDQRDFLSSKASSSDKKMLVQTRMLSDKYDRAYELFQNRLMFPIRNPRGKVVAFGGRTLGDDKAKYINSPESEVFHKSKEIYGLYEASQANRQLDRLLVVEGYMDVVALAQFGISYGVATLGTATNADNLGVLLSRCKNLVFCFDGDAAGIQAARKAMENALPLFTDGAQISFLVLPESEDPDTLVRQEGREAFEARVDNAEPLSSFFFKAYLKGLDLNIAEHRGILKQRAEPQIEKAQSIVLKSALKKQLNDLTFPKRQWGDKNWKDKKGGNQSAGPESVATDAIQVSQVVRDVGLTYCLAAVYFPDRATELLDQSRHLAIKPIAINFLERVAEMSCTDSADLLAKLASDSHGARAEFRNLFDRLDWVPGPDAIAEELEDVLARKRVDQKRSAVISPLNSVASPGQLSPEQREALKAMTKAKTQQS